MEVGKVLNIARIVVDPRQGYALHFVSERVPGIFGSAVVGIGRASEVKFVDVDIIESNVEVLLAAPLQKLRLDLGIINLRDSD